LLQEVFSQLKFTKTRLWMGKLDAIHEATRDHL